jgi:hypothetical protein
MPCPRATRAAGFGNKLGRIQCGGGSTVAAVDWLVARLELRGVPPWATVKRSTATPRIWTARRLAGAATLVLQPSPARGPCMGRPAEHRYLSEGSRKLISTKAEQEVAEPAALTA